ncbi:hypothetical protein J2T37_001925 [Neisseria perflava]|nr:hypothetical protein [Neisseria perflava]MCP1772962.1 hypothetical protein [Neisseria perflava]
MLRMSSGQEYPPYESTRYGKGRLKSYDFQTALFLLSDN